MLHNAAIKFDWDRGNYCLIGKTQKLFTFGGPASYWEICTRAMQGIQWGGATPYGPIVACSKKKTMYFAHIPLPRVTGILVDAVSANPNKWFWWRFTSLQALSGRWIRRFSRVYKCITMTLLLVALKMVLLLIEISKKWSSYITKIL